MVLQCAWVEQAQEHCIYNLLNGVFEENLSRERDVQGQTLGDRDGVFILEHICYLNAGDCIQVNNPNAVNTYIGHIKCHSEGENCLDVKSYN